MSSVWVALIKTIILFSKSEPVAVINVLWVALKKKETLRKYYLKLIVKFL